MTYLTAASCGQCGAPNEGTKFCEDCGAPASTPLAASVVTLGVPPAPSSAQARIGATPARVLVLISFLLSGTVPAILQFANSNSGTYLPELYRGSSASLLGLAALFALIAAVAGKAGPAGKTFGALFALAYAGLGIFPLYGQIPGMTGYTYSLLLVTTYLLLYFSWAFGRPFRGAGYFGLLILLVVGVLGVFIPSIPGLYSNYAGGLAVDSLVFGASTWAVVGFSVLFESRHALSTVPARQTVAMDARTNPRAKLALGFTLGSLGVQLLSSLLTVLFIAGGQYAAVGYVGVLSYLATGAFLAAIVLGHVARFQVRRTGERGGGLALAALIICYSLIALAVIALLVQWLLLNSITNYYD